jgi:hypothetical protein
MEKFKGRKESMKLEWIALGKMKTVTFSFSSRLAYALATLRGSCREENSLRGGGNSRFPNF